jgi:hypothetical protein
MDLLVVLAEEGDRGPDNPTRNAPRDPQMNLGMVCEGSEVTVTTETVGTGEGLQLLRLLQLHPLQELLKPTLTPACSGLGDENQRGWLNLRGTKGHAPSYRLLT